MIIDKPFTVLTLVLSAPSVLERFFYKKKNILI